VVAGLLILACAQVRAEEVESPAYRSWAKVKPGTEVTVRTTTKSSIGMAITTTKSRLVDIDGTKAMVETWAEIKSPSGETTEIPHSTYPVRRMVPVPAGIKPEEVGRAPGAIARGEEEVSMLGRTYKTLWYDTTGMTESGKSYSRAWITEDVPGLMLKATTTLPEIKVTTIELIEIKAP
jgi:hypothetical protein